MVPYREYTLSSGRVVFGGKDEESNDLLVRETGREETMLHTARPGSPFVRVGEKPTKKEISEAAVFCAKYSQDWRDHKQDVNVNTFLRGNMKKGRFMKTGSWNVTGKEETIRVKKETIIAFEKNLQNNGVSNK